MEFQELVKLVDALRGEKGCPWDKKQTLDSLKPYLVEEVYEAVEAIDQGNLSRLQEELGDLLFHIVFLSRVCSEEGQFGIDDVITFIHAKMKRRHPHVFGGNAKANAEEVLKHWHDMKGEERAQKGQISLMDGIPTPLPALQKAEKVQRRAAQVGFDWEKAEDVLAKVSEELEELERAISHGRQDAISEELGDLLFSVVNVGRFLRVDAEGALRATVGKFIQRFREMERRLAEKGRTLDEAPLGEMDAEWEALKGERASGDTP